MVVSTYTLPCNGYVHFVLTLAMGVAGCVMSVLTQGMLQKEKKKRKY